MIARVFAVFGLWLAIALPAAAQEVRPAKQVSGRIESDTEWSGKIRLIGDVVVAREATLTIRPGTRVIAKPLPGPRGESSTHDLRTELVEIHVFGAIDARGRQGEAIELGSPPELRERKEGEREQLVPSWLGLVLHPERWGESRFAHCVFRGALGAIQCTDGSPEIEDCTFLGCSIGVGAGTAWGDPRGRRRIGPRTPGPAIRRCRFGACDTGVYFDNAGRPTVERSVFLDCRIGVGRWAAGITVAPRGLGALVDRCDFLLNLVAVHGSGSIRNSILYRNRLAFSASGFHRNFAALIDRYHRSHNVYFENGALANDDIPLGAGAKHLDPGYRGPVEKSEALLLIADLESVLGLRPDSQARRCAADGGDPGAWGAVGSKRSVSAGMPPEGGRPFEGWLLPGPPGTYEPADLAALKKLLARGSAIPGPGKKLGNAVHSLFRTEAGVLHLPRNASREGGEVILLTGTRADERCDATLFLGLDGLLIEAFWNGRALPVPENARRFLAVDLRHEVEVEKGANTLLLRIHLQDTDSRFAAHLVGAGLSHLWIPPAGDPPPMIEKVVASAARGKRPGRLIVHLAAHARWLEVVSPATWELTGPDGRRIPIRADGITYEATRKRVVISGVQVERGVTCLLAAPELRDAWGRKPDPAPSPVKVVVKQR